MSKKPLAARGVPAAPSPAAAADSRAATEGEGPSGRPPDPLPSFEDAATAMAAPLIITGTSGAIQYLNPAAARITGWPAEAALGRPLSEVARLLDDRTHEPITSLLERCLDGAPPARQLRHAVLARRSGAETPVDCTASCIRGAHGAIIGATVVFHDLSEERRLREHLSFQARHDPLTGLVNRKEFEHRLQRALHAVREHGMVHALCYLDLDGFKIVNDSCGHSAGDELLRQLATLLLGRVRGRDTLARLGGDEFGILLEHCPVQEAIRVAESLRSAVEQFRFPWSGQVFTVGASIGLAVVDRTLDSARVALSAADAACYRAKDLGRNRVELCEGSAAAAPIRGENGAVRRLHEALAAERFTLHVQPILSLVETSRTPAYEVLLRLDDGEAPLPPASFLATAQRHRLMEEIDRYVVSHAVEWIATHATDQCTPPCLFINLSQATLGSETFGSFLHQVLNEHPGAGQNICFEFAETALGARGADVTRFMDQARHAGCRLAIDGFGGGSWSPYSLKNLNLDFLKIHGDLVCLGKGDPLAHTLIECITRVSRYLGISTIATRVEDPDLTAVLKRLGVDMAQGYALAPPVPLEGIRPRGSPGRPAS